jgi:hypothetical protein
MSHTRYVILRRWQPWWSRALFGLNSSLTNLAILITNIYRESCFPRQFLCRAFTVVKFKLTLLRSLRTLRFLFRMHQARVFIDNVRRIMLRALILLNEHVICLTTRIWRMGLELTATFLLLIRRRRLHLVIIIISLCV